MIQEIGFGHWRNHGRLLESWSSRHQHGDPCCPSAHIPYHHLHLCDTLAKHLQVQNLVNAAREEMYLRHKVFVKDKTKVSDCLEING